MEVGMTPDREKWEKAVKGLFVKEKGGWVWSQDGNLIGAIVDAIENAVEDERKRHIHDKPLREAVKELGQQIVKKPETGLSLTCKNCGCAVKL
jgi:hypothetical protein